MPSIRSSLLRVALAMGCASSIAAVTHYEIRAYDCEKTDAPRCVLDKSTMIATFGVNSFARVGFENLPLDFQIADDRDVVLQDISEIRLLKIGALSTKLPAARKFIIRNCSFPLFRVYLGIEGRMEIRDSDVNVIARRLESGGTLLVDGAGRSGKPKYNVVSLPQANALSTGSKLIVSNWMGSRIGYISTTDAKLASVSISNVSLVGGYMRFGGTLSESNVSIEDTIVSKVRFQPYVPWSYQTILTKNTQLTLRSTRVLVHASFTPPRDGASVLVARCTFGSRGYRFNDIDDYEGQRRRRARPGSADPPAPPFAAVSVGGLLELVRAAKEDGSGQAAEDASMDAGTSIIIRDTKFDGRAAAGQKLFAAVSVRNVSVPAGARLEMDKVSVRLGAEESDAVTAVLALEPDMMLGSGALQMHDIMVGVDGVKRVISTGDGVTLATDAAATVCAFDMRKGTKGEKSLVAQEKLGSLQFAALLTDPADARVCVASLATPAMSTVAPSQDGSSTTTPSGSGGGAAGPRESSAQRVAYGVAASVAALALLF